MYCEHCELWNKKNLLYGKLTCCSLAVLRYIHFTVHHLPISHNSKGRGSYWKGNVKYNRKSLILLSKFPVSFTLWFWRMLVSDMTRNMRLCDHIGKLSTGDYSHSSNAYIPVLELRTQNTQD